VDLGDEFVGLGGDDAGADHGLAVGPLPVLHEPCESEEITVRGVDVEGLLRLPLFAVKVKA